MKQPPTTPIPFDKAGRLPASGDNVAIAVRRLDAGMEIAFRGTSFRLSHTVLEGHRFATERIDKGAPLLSWGLPFGLATDEIQPGDYVRNAKILKVLPERGVDFALPPAPNFVDYAAHYELNENAFQPGRQASLHSTKHYFQGFDRGTRRGIGTRNFVVVLGTTSLTGSFVRSLAERFQNISELFPNIDGVVPIAHTEGGGTTRPNNFDLVMRTLAGFMVHSNVAAVLAVDYGGEVINNDLLRRFLEGHGYPIDNVLHSFLSLKGDYERGFSEGTRILDSWLNTVNGFTRTEQSVEHLKVALQCGGSDAFSGISGNPLAGWVAKETIRFGGTANLCETDELIGAEHYMLDNVRDLETARAFLRKIEEFQERASWHGQSAAGNPSAGNNFRGLYNIIVKSIGAARKKDPEIRLDYVIDYAERMGAPGFYFMDSPGNDLESIAGQIASGCNLILFTTGNGSITNFPFVPTIKIMTNTGRYRLLSKDMDVNAGRYQDGMPMEELGRETFDRMIRVASGERSAGEKAGHSQVQIWREWRQTDGSRLNDLLHAPDPDGEPLVLQRDDPDSRPGSPLAAQAHLIPAYCTERGAAIDRVGLIVPTSLCSGQIARLIVQKLNTVEDSTLRYVALAHTEGCAVAGSSDSLHMRTMQGYLCHPSVERALLLEHGCETTHNGAFRNFLVEQRLPPERFGWASVQLDGGIESVSEKVVRWFRTSDIDVSPPLKPTALERIHVGITTAGPLPDAIAGALALVTRWFVGRGGTVIVAENAGLWESPDYVDRLFDDPPRPSLGFGEMAKQAGMHIMQTPTDHQVETLTGLGAAGAQVILAWVSERLVPAHPLVPVAQISATPFSPFLDLVFGEPPLSAHDTARRLLDLIADIGARAYTPKLLAHGQTDFQMTRGLLGISM